jgi:glycosyltransferase involved in cell wall biosynthesis
LEKSPLKILFISHSSVLKSHQQKLAILAEKHGHEITLVTPPFWPEGGVKITPYTGNPAITYLTGKVWFPKKMVHIYLNARAILKKTNPDLVYIEEEPFDFACYEFISAAVKAGKKTAFFTWENIKRGHNFIYTYFNNFCIGNAFAAVAGNAEAKEILLDRGFKKDVVILPQYGVDMTEFKKKKDREQGAPFNVAYIGRLTMEKGVDLLMNAVSELDNITLHLAGTGPMDGFLRETASGKKLDGRVKFYGHVVRDDIPGFLSAMDCLVLPSITTANWKEQFGRVIIEAFAATVPVIGSDSGEIPGVIGNAGLIFHEGSAEGLQARLRELMAGSDLYKELQNKGLQRVKENFTNEKIAQRLDEFFRALVK